MTPQEEAQRLINKYGSNALSVIEEILSVIQGHEIEFYKEVKKLINQ